MAAAKKTPEKINIAAMQKIVAMLKQRHEEDGALIDELERLAGGGRGIGEILKELYAYWIELWPHGTYVFKFEQDAPNMKRLVRNLGDEELKRRMFRYLKCSDEFYAGKKHPFAMFVATINSWAGSDRRIDDVVEAPVGCTHQPPCRSDVEHTRKRGQELRS